MNGLTNESYPEKADWLVVGRVRDCYMVWLGGEELETRKEGRGGVGWGYEWCQGVRVG